MAAEPVASLADHLAATFPSPCWPIDADERASLYTALAGIHELFPHAATFAYGNVHRQISDTEAAGIGLSFGMRTKRIVEILRRQHVEGIAEFRRYEADRSQREYTSTLLDFVLSGIGCLQVSTNRDGSVVIVPDNDIDTRDRCLRTLGLTQETAPAPLVLDDVCGKYLEMYKKPSHVPAVTKYINIALRIVKESDKMLLRTVAALAKHHGR